MNALSSNQKVVHDSENGGLTPNVGKEVIIVEKKRKDKRFM